MCCSDPSQQPLKRVAIVFHSLGCCCFDSQLVVDWTLVRGVARQVESFKEGVASVLPLSSLHTFYPSEVGPHTPLLLYALVTAVKFNSTMHESGGGGYKHTYQLHQ